ncbi:MAG: ComF family protein [Elusimicrobiota bacterium]
MNIPKTIINSILNFFYPNVCIVCGDSTDGNNLSICRKCLDKIEYIKPLCCQTCSQPLPDGGAHCWQCRKTKYHFEKIVAVGKYVDVLRELILKFKKKDFLKNVLGNLLIKVLKKNVNIKEFDLIVAVPLSKKKEFFRGYNQSQLLSEFIACKFDKQVIKGNLIRARNTKSQFELTREERLINLKNAFKVKNPLVFENKNVILVDDIATTCSTLEECSIVLKNAGAKKVLCAVLARD